MIRFTFERTPKEDQKPLEETIGGILGLPCGSFEFEIRKKSLDARKSKVKFVYTVDVFTHTKNEKALAKRCKGVISEPEGEYVFPKSVRKKSLRPVVAGFGPAGIFAALMLAREGYRPIVLERGKSGEERKKDVDEFFSGGKFDPESNIQYGEGGAGAFSDGKLNTLVKDKSFRGRLVLKELVRAGAPEETLFMAKPHIGTDLLRKVVENLREEIISLGGDVRFQTKLEKIETDGNGKLTAVIANGERIETDTLFLATGQSAREIAEMMFEIGAEIEKKPFSVGFRIEHPQTVIDISQYGDNDDLRFLPPAEYKLFRHCSNGRTVYSFCMCPGGYVVSASSEEERLVTNGMSYHARNKTNSNCALAVSVLKSDFSNHPMRAIEFQRELEKKAFLNTSDYRAPAQTVGDFLNGRKTPSFNGPVPTYPHSVAGCNLDTSLPSFVSDMLKKGLRRFGSQYSFFKDATAPLTAVETRTSSPIRIEREKNFRVKGFNSIFPCGEGAGWAGGITSAAVDGLRCAEEYIKGNLI